MVTGDSQPSRSIGVGPRALHETPCRERLGWTTAKRMSWLDPADLHARLRGFEWDDLEANLAATGIPSSAYASVSAFANTSGGCLVFGVQDVGARLEVVGVGNPDAAQNDFVSTCRSAGKFSVPVDVRTAWLDIDGKIVLAFAVPPSGRHDRPVRVREDRTWHA